MRGEGIGVVARQAQSRRSVADEAAHQFDYPISLMLCSSPANMTLLKAPVMLSDSSVATPSLFCHVAWIC
jgi:hypothetical protein